MLEIIQSKGEELLRREEEGKTMRLLYESEVGDVVRIVMLSMLGGRSGGSACECYSHFGSCWSWFCVFACTACRCVDDLFFRSFVKCNALECEYCIADGCKAPTIMVTMLQSLCSNCFFRGFNFGIFQ